MVNMSLVLTFICLFGVAKTLAQRPYPAPAPAPPSYPSPSYPAPAYPTTTTYRPAPNPYPYPPSPPTYRPQPPTTTTQSYPAPSYPTPRPYPAPAYPGPSPPAYYPAPGYGSSPAYPARPPVLNLDNINPVCKPLFDITPLLRTVARVQAELDQKVPKPFDRLIDVSFENPQAMWQKPLTAVRQLLASTILPEVQAIVPVDIAEKAKLLLSKFPGNSIGSYTDPRGLPEIRKHIAAFINKRDQVAANESQIILANGPYDAFRDIIKLIANDIGDKRRGVLIPAPSCEFHSDIVKCEGLCRTMYNYDPDNGWLVTLEALQAALDEQSRYCLPAAIVVTNPALPSGHVHSRAELELIVNFAYDNELVIISNEGHQDEVWDPELPFIAIRKVAAELGKNVEVISILSSNFAHVGEAGIAGAAYEFFYVDPEVVDSWVEVIRYLKFCANTPGQIVMDALVNPPKKGEPSFIKWDKEKLIILTHIRKNAELVEEQVAEISGVSLVSIQGGIDAFIKIDSLPDAYIQGALDQGLTVEERLVLQLVEKKGVITVPGSWLAQPDGTHHICVSLLPDSKDVKSALAKLEELLNEIQEQYADKPIPDQYLPAPSYP